MNRYTEEQLPEGVVPAVVIFMEPKVHGAFANPNLKQRNEKQYRLKLIGINGKLIPVNRMCDGEERVFGEVAALAGAQEWADALGWPVRVIEECFVTVRKLAEVRLAIQPPAPAATVQPAPPATATAPTTTATAPAQTAYKSALLQIGENGQPSAWPTAEAFKLAVNRSAMGMCLPSDITAMRDVLSILVYIAGKGCEALNHPAAREMFNHLKSINPLDSFVPNDAQFKNLQEIEKLYSLFLKQTPKAENE
jgi:hypothetical protein